MASNHDTIGAVTPTPEAPFAVTPEERDAIKEIIAGLVFICEIGDTGQLVDHAFNELERRRNAGEQEVPHG